MITAHTPSRPGWRCSGCGEDWPCAVSRADLRIEFEGHRAQLAVYMARHLSEALADQPDTAESALYDRFLGWFRDRQR